MNTAQRRNVVDEALGLARTLPVTLGSVNARLAAVRVDIAIDRAESAAQPKAKGKRSLRAA